MKPILFSSTSTSWNSNGLGALSDAVSCTVVEERNGEYELTMEYPVGGIHFDEIHDRAIILAKPSPYRDPQPFRIYSVESPLNGIVTIHAHHISYDLSGIPVEPFTASSCSTALSGLVSHSVVSNPFSVATDKSVTATYKLKVPTSFRGCLGGQEGSILDVYGKGEYEFDKYQVKLWVNRGSDNGVKIAYGKNLTDFNMERNLESVTTGIYPFWSDFEGDELVEIPNRIITIYDPLNPTYLVESGGAYLTDDDGKYLTVQTVFNFNNVLPLDLSSEFDEKPTPEQLRERAEKYITDNSLGVPKVSIDVSFVHLEQTEEYKDLAVLEAVDLCDTVTVEFPMYGISVKAKIVRIETDVLLERYTAVQIGDTRPTIADTIASLATNSVTKQEAKNGNALAADVINNTKGVFEWIDSDDDGENEGFTIYETEGVAFLRCTAGGIGLSQDGGLTYTNAITKYGVVASQLDVVEDGISILTARADSGTVPRITFRNLNNQNCLKIDYVDYYKSSNLSLFDAVKGYDEAAISLTVGRTGTMPSDGTGGYARMNISDPTPNSIAGISLYTQYPDEGYPQMWMSIHSGNPNETSSSVYMSTRAYESSGNVVTNSQMGLYDGTTGNEQIAFVCVNGDPYLRVHQSTTWRNLRPVRVSISGTYYWILAEQE